MRRRRIALIGTDVHDEGSPLAATCLALRFGRRAIVFNELRHGAEVDDEIEVGRFAFGLTTTVIQVSDRTHRLFLPPAALYSAWHEPGMPWGTRIEITQPALLQLLQ